MARELPQSVSVSALRAAYAQLRAQSELEKVECGGCILSMPELRLACIVTGDGDSVGPECMCRDGEGYIGFAHTHLPDRVTGRWHLGFSAGDYRGTLADGDKLALVTAGEDLYALVRVEDCTLSRQVIADTTRWQAFYDTALHGEKAASGAIDEALWEVNVLLCEELGFAFYRGRFGKTVGVGIPTEEVPKMRQDSQRDDAALNKAVGEARQRLQRDNIAETEFDWIGVVRRERELHWADRWRVAREQLGDLLHTTENLTEAALEVVFDAVRGTAVITKNAITQCVRTGVQLEFDYSSAAQQMKALHRVGSSPVEELRSMGVFLTSTIPGAQIVADMSQQTLTVDFLPSEHEFTVMLVPESFDEEPRIKTYSKVSPASVVFDNVAQGGYLLAIQIKSDTSEISS